MHEVYVILSIAGWIWLVVFGIYLAIRLRRLTRHGTREE